MQCKAVLDRQTLKMNSTETQVDRPSFPETRPVVIRRGAGRRYQGGPVRTRELVRTVSFCFSLSVAWLATDMEENWNRANSEGKIIASMETGDIKSILSRSQPMLAQESIARELLTTTSIGHYYALAQCLEAQRDVSVSRSFRNEASEQVKEER